MTDRPDQTESTATIAPGRMQLEAGLAFSQDEESANETQVLEGPGTLLRIGLARDVELRLGWTGIVDEEMRFRGREDSESGIGDGELGVKLRLGAESGPRPEMALLVASSLPVGEEPFSSDRFDPSFRLAFAHSLTETVALGYNLGAEWTSEPTAGGRSTRARGLYTLALGFTLSERWAAFAEVFGDFSLSAPGPPETSVDGGLTWLLRPNLQLDAAAGVGLSDEAPDWFLGLGVSLRVPR